jgi:murein DD-endopeptidase MepM/ murein hydrolase activator NlpD
VGNTGNSYGAHLHFELVYGGAKLNPLDFLP